MIYSAIRPDQSFIFILAITADSWPYISFLYHVVKTPEPVFVCRVRELLHGLQRHGGWWGELAVTSEEEGRDVLSLVQVPGTSLPGLGDLHWSSSDKRWRITFCPWKLQQENECLLWPSSCSSRTSEPPGESWICLHQVQNLFLRMEQVLNYYYCYYCCSYHY